MGNSLRVVLDNYIGSAPFPCHLQLGPTTSIDLSRDLRPKNHAGVVKEIWCVTYKVDEKDYEARLTKHDVDQHGNVEKVEFSAQNGIITCGRLRMVATETNYIRIDPCRWNSYFGFKLSTKSNRSFDATGAVMDTTVNLYGSESRWSLLVVESKKNRREEEAEVVTLAHYFVNSSGTSFYESTGTDIGLSVVAKFRVSNGKFQITVEGLEQHPVSSLLYMFDQVHRTGNWKPTMCPHCDHNRRGKLFWQSDSEDSDSVSMPLPRATPRNARGVSNGGRFQGNGNGNFYENNVMVFKRR